MTLPRVQVVLLNWNGSIDTIACLESLFGLDYPEVGVVVCDNGSSDDSVERLVAWADGRLSVAPAFRGPRPGRGRARRAPVAWARYDRETAEAGGRAEPAPPLVIIETGANLGFAGGNNVALRYLLARGDADYVWLLNNDMIVAPSALGRLVQRAAADDRIGAVGGTLLEFTAPETVQYAGVADYSLWRGRAALRDAGRPASAPRDASRPFDFISGGCMLVRMDAVARVGLLDERFFMYSEDVDWSLRLRGAGFELAYAPDADVWHKGGASTVYGSPSHEYQHVRSSLLLVAKHQPARLAIAAAYSMASCLVPKALRREWDGVAAVVRAYRDVAGVMRARAAAARAGSAPARAASIAPALTSRATR